MIKRETYDRAVEHYNSLPDGPEKQQKLAMLREIVMITDETNFDLSNAAYAAIEKVAQFNVNAGVLTPEDATRKLAEAEDYFMGVPQAKQRLFEQSDKGGWLADWLTRHPEFVQQELNGEWPQWLAKPRS
jgi:hypothetical protein